MARVAVNLRGVGADEVARGAALLSLRGFLPTASVDVGLSLSQPGGGQPRRMPVRAMLHVGTAAVEVHVRPLSGETARLTLPRPLPLRVGDRAILRDPGQRLILGGLTVLDTDPPALRRRGEAAKRGAELATATGAPDLTAEVERRGAMRVEQARGLGFDVAVLPAATTPGATVPAAAPPVVARRGDWLVARGTWQAWRGALSEAARRRSVEEPLEPTLSLEAARALADIPDLTVLLEVADDAGLRVEEGRVGVPGAKPSLGAQAERGLGEIEARLAADPFAAPESRDLEAAGLGPRQLAAAVRLGRVLRLHDDIVLLTTAPARAMRVLAALPQPFTTSDARQALGSTRRVVIPLLEHLDARGWTRRLDASHREIKR